MFISIAEFIIATIVVSCGAAGLVGAIVYVIMSFKYNKAIANLTKELDDAKAELKNLSKFRCLYNRYRKYKEYEGNSSPRSEDFLNWKVLDDDL